MKKPIAIACVILLLAIFIGVERFNGTSRSQPSAVTDVALTNNKPTNVRRVRTQDHSDPTANIPSSSDSLVVPAIETASEKVDFTSQQAPLSVGNAVSEYTIPAILYLRGGSILRAYKPDKESIAKLQEAVKQVAIGFDHPVIIFDLDGLATSQSRFISYANPKFELTKEVEVVYLKLKAKDSGADKKKITGRATASEGDKLSD